MGKSIFNSLGYFFCEISFGITGSGTRAWSRRLFISNEKLQWFLGSPLYDIGNYFYNSADKGE